MLATYEEWNKIEDEATPAAQIKATALANAISRCVRHSLLPRLRETAGRIRLAGAKSSRPIILSLLKFGNKSDVRLVLDRIANEEFSIYFTNHTELGRALMKRMAEVESSVPKFLSSIISKREFWDYIPAKDQGEAQPGDLLPLKDWSNRSLYIRIVGYAVIGAANEKDSETLISLANHNYGLIARAAAIRLVQLFGLSALSRLAVMIPESLTNGTAQSLSDAIRHAEIELYGVATLW